MHRRLIMTGCLAILALALSVSADPVKTGSKHALDPIQPRLLREGARLATADTCYSMAFDSMAWYVDQWIMGDELYKVLLDPATTCDNPYPYSIVEVHMIIGFGGTTTFTYSGDIEAIDYSNPGCPLPDTLLGLSETYVDDVPEPEFYDIWVEFDPPVVVSGPFFAGFYIGAGLDPYADPLIITDDTPVACNSFNIWDESIGWIDMVDNDYYNFPGRLAMFAVGVPGGGTIDPPVADFSATPTTLCPGGSVAFTNLSTGTISSYAWSFGDGGSSTESSPAHVYASAGQYTISLTTTGEGGSDTETKSNYITVSAAPTANFTASPTSGAAPLYVNFTNQSTNGTSWLWNFGDGTTSTLQQPSHNYPNPGSYTVSLTASSLCGTDVETRTNLITVQDSTSIPAPELTWLSTGHGDVLLGAVELWVAETTGSEHVDYVTFEYSSGGGYVPIGTDFDGTSPLRDGTTAASTGTGFSLYWDFSALPEGTYTLRATVYDTLGQNGSAIATVYLEPTPPTAVITTPDNGDDFCSELTLLMFSNDADLSYVEVHRRQAARDYSAGLSTISALARNNAPAAAALAARLWADRGYAVMEAGGTLTTAQLTDSLAVRCNTIENNGTYDDDFLAGLRAYFGDHGNLLVFDYQRTPDYYALRIWVEEEQRAVIIGLSGASGRWLAVDGFDGWPESGEDWMVTISDPATGVIADLPLRDNFTNYQILYHGSWHTIDIMISLTARNWSVNRQLMGADFNGADGWSFAWTPTDIFEDSLYFFRSTGHDAGGMSGFSTILLRYSCATAYVAGDYNNDRVANIMDLVYLVDFITGSGSEPVGGTPRADANGDGYVNIADVVYYMTDLFGESEPPTF